MSHPDEDDNDCWQATPPSPYLRPFPGLSRVDLPSGAQQLRPGDDCDDGNDCDDFDDDGDDCDDDTILTIGGAVTVTRWTRSSCHHYGCF